MGHKLNLFAHVEGHTIRGNAYFPGNVPAQGTQVTAVAPNGRELGRTTSDREGKFVLEARVRSDTKLVAATEDGHGAEYILHAAELPEDLPAVPSDGSPRVRRNSRRCVPRAGRRSPAQDLLGEIQALCARSSSPASRSTTTSSGSASVTCSAAWATSWAWPAWPATSCRCGAGTTKK